MSVGLRHRRGACEMAGLKALRYRARRRGLRVRKRGDLCELHDGDGLLFSGAIDAVESYLRARYTSVPIGRVPWVVPPPEWAAHIEAFLTTLVAAGQSPATIALRREKLVENGSRIGGLSG